MPKVNLTEKDKLLGLLQDTIAIQAIVTNNRTPCDRIPNKLGIPYSTWKYKLHNGSLDWWTLKRLFDSLHFSDEQILKTFGR